MWKAFRIALQKGCVFRDLRVRPSLVATGDGDDQNIVESWQRHAVCTTPAYQSHGAFVSQASPVRSVFIRDAARNDNDSRQGRNDNDSRRSVVCSSVDQDCQTVTDGEDAGGGNFSGNADRFGWSEAQHQNAEKEDQSDRADFETDWYWKHWSKSFQQNICSYHHPCHVLEAITWGTAILSLFRVSQFLDHFKDRPQEVQRCWFQHAQKVTTAIIKQHLLQFEMGYGLFSTTIKSVLPQGVFGSLPIPSTVCEDHDRELVGRSTVKPYGIFLSDQNNRSIPYAEDVSTEVHEAVEHLPKPSAVTDAESIKSAEISFGETLNDWGEALRSVTAAVNNAEGVRLARHGDMEGAIRLWKKAVDEAGSDKAHFNLALAYEQGLGVEKNLDKALEHYSSASLKDHPASMFNSAMIHLGQPLEAGKNKAIAMGLLEKAAKLGLKEAQRELGVLYTEPPNSNMDCAASLFKKAAAQKDMKATYFLGICYENGWGVELNEATAVTMYEKAAAAGHAEALYNLGVFYETGRGGLACDQRKAAELYRMSCGCGCIKARQELKRLEAILAKEEDMQAVNFIKRGSDADISKNTSSARPQSKMAPSAPRFSRLAFSCESDIFSEDSDSESFYMNSVSESSSSEDEMKNLSMSRKHTSSASQKSDKLMFGGKKSLRSGIFIGFSSDEETSDSSEVEEYTKSQPIQLAHMHLA